MNNPIVSIIIPIFNTSNFFLKKCMNSVLNQEYTNIEVIIVDDGSKEETHSLCDELTLLDKRIKVIHQSNQGVCVARNAGVNEAKGKYMMFVDSDDILYPKAIAQGVKIAEERNADMVIGCIHQIRSLENIDAYAINKAGSQILELTTNSFNILRFIYFNSSPKELKSFCKEGYVSRGPVARLISTEYAKKNMFPVDIPLGEDVIWNLRLLNKVHKICISNDIWYGYYIHENSAIRKYYGNRERLVFDYLSIVESENADFCSSFYSIYGNFVVVEFYCILKYELMNEQCGMTGQEKNLFVQNMLCRKPWNILRDTKIKKTLPIKYKFLLGLCRFNSWRLVTR